MPTGTQFGAQVFENGFQVVDGQEVSPQLFAYTANGSLPKERFLIPNEGNYRFVDPLKVDDLFLRFAALESSEEAICEFASEYGWLGRGVATNITLSGSEVSQGNILAEPIRVCLTDIAAMSRAIKLWELSVKDIQFSKLKEIVAWKDKRAVTIVSPNKEAKRPTRFC